MSPLAAVAAGSAPASRSAAQRSAVRRSCHTMALWIGLPVLRSQTSVVSRWLVMPIAATSLGLDARLAQRRAAGGDDRAPDVLRVVLDPAGLRIDLAEFLLRHADDLRAARSKTMARVDVVPWSIARMWSAMAVPPLPVAEPSFNCGPMIAAGEFDRSRRHLASGNSPAAAGRRSDAAMLQEQVVRPCRRRGRAS